MGFSQKFLVKKFGEIQCRFLYKNMIVVLFGLVWSFNILMNMIF